MLLCGQACCCGSFPTNSEPRMFPPPRSAKKPVWHIELWMRSGHSSYLFLSFIYDDLKCPFQPQEQIWKQKIKSLFFGWMSICASPSVSAPRNPDMQHVHQEQVKRACTWHGPSMHKQFVPNRSQSNNSAFCDWRKSHFSLVTFLIRILIGTNNDMNFQNHARIAEDDQSKKLVGKSGTWDAATC